MIEILFRGKRTDNGEWAEGFYARIYDSKGNVSHRIYPGYAESDCGEFYPEWFEVDPSTVGQFTGLCDSKNGKRIFEGDIVKSVALDNDHFQKGAKAISLVENCMGNTCLRLGGKHMTGTTLYHISINHIVEVIGNIHDNPELLEEDKG